MSKLLNKIKDILSNKYFLFITIFFLFIAILIYLLINKTTFFYQQDEYYGFFYLNNTTILDNIKSIASIHYSPFSVLFLRLQYFLFGLSIEPRIIISLLLHFIAIFSLFNIIKKIAINNKINILISISLLILFFGINVNNSQAYLWMSTYSGTIPCLIFSIWSFIFFLKSRDNDNKQIKNIIISSILLIISLLFKEYSIILPILFCFIILKENNFKLKDLFKKEKDNIFIISIIFIIFLVIRILMQLFSGNKSDSDIISSRFTIINIIDSFVAYINIFFKAFWQIIIPYDFYKYFVIEILKQENSDNVFILINKIQLILGFFTWLFIFAMIYIKKLFQNKHILITFAFYLLSIVPFTLITTSFSSDYLESRYYYMISATLLLFIITIIQNSLKSIILRLFLLLISLLIIFLNILYINNKIQEQKALSNIRINIINSIIENIKNTKDNILIINVYGDNEGYYGLTDLQFPFQAGLGNMLAIHLYDQNIFINKKYFKNKDNFSNSNYIEMKKTKNQNHEYKDTGLWPMNYNRMGQGVYDFDNRKFGFFYNYDDMRLYFNKHDNEIDNLYSFYWDKKNNNIIDKTTEIRNKIKESNIRYKLDSDIKIEKDINILTNNKYNFSVDSKIGIKTYKDGNNIINVYKNGLEQSYASTYLNFDINGNNTNKYQIDRLYNNYYLDFVNSIKINGLTTPFNQKIIGNNIYIEFSKNISKNDLITLNFSLKSRTFLYENNSSNKYYLETDFIKIRGNNSSVYSLNLKNNVVSIRSIWMDDNKRYEPFGISDNNGLIKITNWPEYNSKNITINFERVVKLDEEIIIPIVYYKDIKELSEEIYFNYK